MNRFSRSASRDSTDPFADQAFCANCLHQATPGIAALAKRDAIYLDQRFADHAPLIIDHDFTL